ncbi:MAG: hypothetical protein HOC20_00395, partial [Chloroflexi bacterium]|nr:hypothetical protein [Chloroflexota bacterium]
MPKKYHVNVQPSAPRFEPISKYCTMETKPCLHCRLCVKLDACVYDVNKTRGFDHVQILDPGDYQCMGCLRCIQECKANILTRTRNSRFDAMGNDYWKPDLISSIWTQSETGKIPVSGAGYRGPFSGPGFDQMWTDMSEIVRPTRDGIHGREYISTVIELGRRPERLEFDDDGNLITQALPFRDIQIPIILDIPPVGMMGESTRQAIAKAAGTLSTLAVAEYEEARGPLTEHREHLIVRFDPQKDFLEEIEGVPLVELAYSESVLNAVVEIKKQSPGTVISIRLPLDENAVERASGLAMAG